MSLQDRNIMREIGIDKNFEKEKLSTLGIQADKELFDISYCCFNLKLLAEKIRTQTYRPKPKMLYR